MNNQKTQTKDEAITAPCPTPCYGGRKALMSDCGNFVAIYWGDDVLNVDVIHRDGRIWRGRRKNPQTFADEAKTEYMHAEFPKMVGGWGNLGRQKRDGGWTEDFDLSFCDMDQTKDQFTDASAGSNRCDASFRRRVPPKRPMSWVRRIIDEYQEPNAFD